MPDNARITIANRIPEIQRAADFLDGFLTRNPVPDGIARELHVILDEILSNVIRHGFDDGQPHEIGFALAGSPHEVTLQVDDDGKPFDPTAAPAPASRPRAPLDQLDTGGLGLVFVKAFADSVSYRREGSRNRLTVTRRLPAAARQAPARDALALAETREGTVYTLELEGRLDSTTAWVVKDRLLAMIEDGARHVIVDASRTGYIGSAGFWVLLLVDRRLKARGGGLALCGLTAECVRALEQGGFDSLLAVFDGSADALASMRAAGTRAT